MIKSVTILVLAMLPSIATIFLLIEFFPYTGLGRIVSIPVTLILNLTFFAWFLFLLLKLKSRTFKLLLWIAAILLSVALAIFLHPQEHLPNVMSQLWNQILLD